MLSESFVFLPGVKGVSERNFWSQCINSWDDFIGAEKVRGVGVKRKVLFDSLLREAKLNLREFNSCFFRNMPDSWRLYDLFKDEAVFLDIETNGYYGDITVIGISDGLNSKFFVKGFNLDRSLFLKELSKYKLIVTFNGASFDLPVIERFFGFKFAIPHIDLRFVCQKLGYVGGLKSIERQLGIFRRKEVVDIRGEDAVYLWEMWRSSGERDYLDKLIMYNEEDVLNLKPIAERLIPLLWQKTRFMV